jgi:Tripartite tricarboxylate transporter family receptor
LVQVKNVLGGAGMTGFAELAASKPDGYMFGLVNVGGLLIFPHIMRVPYTRDSFSFLGGVAENCFGIGIAANSPIKTVEALVGAVKTRMVTYSASAIMNGVDMIQLGNATGVKFQFVPTSTRPEAVAQAVGGHVDVVLQTPPDLVPLIDGGQLRLLLASATEYRWPNYPDVKTLKEKRGAPWLCLSGRDPAGDSPKARTRGDARDKRPGAADDDEKPNDPVTGYDQRRVRPCDQIVGRDSREHSHDRRNEEIVIQLGGCLGVLILWQSRRELLWLGVTAHPNAEWLARQLPEACRRDQPPRYLIRERDGAYVAAFSRHIRTMGIRDRPVLARSPKKSPAERRCSEFV